MPANVSQAAFQPVSPWLNLDELVEKTDNFQYVTRVSLETIEAQGPAALNRLITLHVLVGGKPLVIEGFHKKLPRHLFSHGWLDENKGLKAEQTRDLTRGKNLPMTINNYLKHMSKLTEQWWLPKGTRAADEGQRLYLKDIDCPEAWHSYLAALIPPTLFYLNESTGDIGGPASVDEQAGPFGSTTKGKGIAPAGDLMSSLSPEMRAENMMCYIGHEGTYTPSHREMCATLGHNLMVETSGNGVDKWGKRERAGSSIWFMTETKDRYQVSEYWLSVLGHDIEIENHFAQVNAWKLAPFRTYIVEQKAGDFILIPPLAPHQVWNRGTRTMKVAWNRTSVETLELALNEALPRARMVCRDEQYKCKAILFFTLEKYYNLLRRIDPDYSDGWGAAAMSEINRSRKIFQLKKDYRRLFNLFTDVMLGEMFSSDRPQEKKVEMLEFDGNVTCAFCRCNIFNRFLTCKSCIVSNDGGEDDAYDVCMECYAMGRSCWCQSGLKWVQQFPWDKLLEKYEDWRQMAIRLDGVVNESSPQRLSVARQRRGKKTLAEICQEQLDVRPYRDPNKLDDDLIAKEQAARAEDEEEPVEVDDQGRQKKRRSSMKKRKSGVGQKAQSACHICRHGEVDWKLANCTSCERKYCYGTLFRAFDLMPQQIMEDPNWQCPHCLKICSCGACRKDSSMTAYEPSGTLVGHDTKLVADPRSVESLVDFSRSNISWIEKHTRDEVPNEVNPYETARLRRLRKRAEAEHEMAQRDLGAAYADLHTHSDADADDVMEDAPYEIEHGRSVADGSAIDPQLSQVSGTNRYGIVRQSTYLPPPAAMLDGAPANGIQPDPSGLSELERNPQQLLDSIAALDDREAAEAPHRPQFVSPAAMMIDCDGPSSHHNFGLVRDQPEAPPNQKRKHHSIESEEDGELDDANREYQRAQTRRTIDEARRQNRFFQTQGRLRGKSLIVKLSVDMPRLNQALQDTERQTEQNASDEVATGVVFGADGAADHSAFAPVESDLPDPTIDLRFRVNGERVGSELHAQSTWRKSHGLVSSERKKAGKSRKDVSEDDVDEDGDIIITEAECSPKQRKPRESAWLARKYEGEEPMAVPAEISGLTRRPRTSNGTAKSKQPISRSKPGRSDWNSVKPSTIKPGSIRSSLRRTAKPSSPVVPFAALDDEGSDSDESSFEEVDAEYNAVTVVVRPSSASQAGPGSNCNTPRPNDKGTPRSDRRSSHKSIQFADEIGHEDAKAMALRIAEGRTSETPDGSRVSSSESFGEHSRRLPRGRPSKGVRNSLARAQVD